MPSIDSAGAVCAILAAGSSTRAGTDKITADLGGQPVLAWSIASALASGAFARIVVVVRPDAPRDAIEAIVRSRARDASVVPGGDTRTQSSWAALAKHHPHRQSGGADGGRVVPEGPIRNCDPCPLEDLAPEGLRCLGRPQSFA